MPGESTASDRSGTFGLADGTAHDAPSHRRRPIGRMDVLAVSRADLQAADGYRRHVVTVAGQRSRAAKFRGDTCERCGFQGDGLHAHHRDGDVTNSVASNIETVCASCHISGHWAAKRANGVAA